MEVTYLFGADSITKMENVKSMNTEDQRYLFFMKQLSTYLTVSMAETNTHIYWSSTEYKPYFNVKVFYKKKSNNGLTYDKKTKELKIWFGKIPDRIILDSFFKLTGVDYMNMLSYSFSYMVTPGMLKKMAKGKISTVEEYAQYLVKNMHAFKKTDLDQLLRLVYKSTDTSPYFSLNFHLLGNILFVAKCSKDAVEYILSNPNISISTVISYAMALNEKIDFKNLDNEKIRLIQLNKNYQNTNNLKTQNYDYNTVDDTQSIDLPF